MHIMNIIENVITVTSVIIWGIGITRAIRIGMTDMITLIINMFMINICIQIIILTIIFILIRILMTF